MRSPEPEEPSSDEAVAIASPAVRMHHRGVARLCTRAALCLLPINVALYQLDTSYSSIPGMVGPAWLRALVHAIAHYGLGQVAFVAVLVLGVLADRVPWPPAFAAELWFGRDGVRLRSGARERRIPTQRLLGGIELPSARGGSQLELQIAGGRVLRVELAAPGAARRALSALGLGGDRRRTTVVFSGPIHTLYSGLLVLCSGALVALIAIKALWELTHGLLSLRVTESDMIAPLLAIFALWLGVMSRWLRPIQVTVGVDGVTVRRPWRTRFFPHARLEAVVVHGATLTLMDHDGSLETLSLSADGGDVGVLDALEQRISEARANGAAGAHRGSRAALLEARGKKLGAWREVLRALGQKTRDYRGAGVTAEEAQQVLEDATASAEQRIGAALLLRDSGDPEAPARIRLAVAATASDSLRRALVRVADDTLEEAALEEAIDEERAAGRGTRTA